MIRAPRPLRITSMSKIRLYFLLAAIALSALIFWALGADDRGLFAVLAGMAGEPWTVVTLADLYLGFAVSAAIIILAERRLASGLLWAAPIFVLGNLWTALWLAVRLPSLARRLRSRG